ncbi:hypothetical protein BsWGS_14595 [Bradybaena similaris]
MDFTKMKGSLGLKSSALAPTACKLSSQFLVLDHMSNHYTKIAKAKSAIDSRPPKSLMTSQKMRDRMNHSRLVGSPQPRLHSSASGTVLYDYEDILKDEPEDEEEKLVHSIMRSTLLEKSSRSNIATYGAEPHMSPYQHQQMSTNIHETSPYGALIYNHPASVRSARSGHSLTSTPSRMAIATSLLVKRTCKADVLEKRPHLFTEPERPFTPRTLKKNTESRLKNSKCYNPPRNKSVKNENNREIDNDNNNKKDKFQNYEKDTVKGFEKGVIKNKKQQSKLRAPPPQKVDEHQEYELETTAGTTKLSNSVLMDISLRSQDRAYNPEIGNSVPPLAISVDKDHMNWLQEQASKAEVRVRSSGQLKSSLHPDITMERLRKDEEQKYLAFAKEVTDDVLSRGISSDSVLDTVFENHIIRRKGDLDEGCMRKVISDLHKKLGLKDSFTRGRASASLSDINYNRSRKEHTTNSRSRDSHQTHFDSDVNTTLESVNTFTFGQTGDVLSTINSEASLKRKEMENKLSPDIEMAVSQTLRDYQLSLTDKEKIDDSVRESEHSAVKEDRLKQKPTTNERRIATEGKLRAEVSSVSGEICNPDKSHVDNDEDTSIGSSVLSQQPVARPRTKARQEGTQAQDGQVVHHAQQNVIHRTTAGLDDNNTPTAGESDSTDPGYTKEHPSAAARHETDQQQADEVDEEYDDDYEEVIDSENDSADDF